MNTISGENLAELPYEPDGLTDQIVFTLLNSNRSYTAAELSQMTQTHPGQLYAALHNAAKYPFVNVTAQNGEMYWQTDKVQALQVLQRRGGVMELTYDERQRIVQANIIQLGRNAIKQSSADVYGALKTYPILNIKELSSPEKGYIALWGAWARYQTDSMRTLDDEATNLFAAASKAYLTGEPQPTMPETLESKKVYKAGFMVSPEGIIYDYETTNRFEAVSINNPFATPEYLVEVYNRIMAAYSRLKADEGEKLTDKVYDIVLDLLAGTVFTAGVKGFNKYLNDVIRTKKISYLRSPDSKHLYEVPFSLLRDVIEGVSTGESTEDVIIRQEFEATRKETARRIIEALVSLCPPKQRHALTEVYGLNDEPPKSTAQVAAEMGDPNVKTHNVTANLAAALRQALPRLTLANPELVALWRQLEAEADVPYVGRTVGLWRVGEVALMLPHQIWYKSVVTASREKRTTSGSDATA